MLWGRLSQCLGGVGRWSLTRSAAGQVYGPPHAHDSRKGQALDEVTALHRATYDAIAEAYDDDARLGGPMPPTLAEPFERLCAAVPRGGLVADLGCGPGRHVVALRERGLRAVGVDLSLGMLQRAATRASGSVVAGDLRALPLGSGTCAGAWSSYALLHLSDVEVAAALREVHRVLRPGGTAALVLAAGTAGLEPVRYAPERSRRFFARSADVVVGLADQAGLTVVAADTVPEGWRSPVRVVLTRAG